MVKNFPDAKIWIVGEAPDWYDGDVIYVPQSADKYTNAQKNMQTICSSEQIPEDFVMMNDDFYIVGNVSQIKYYNGGALKDKCQDYAQRNPRSTYTRRLFNTYKTLKRIGVHDSLDYELHVPFPVQKTKLAKAISYGVLWRSVYGNLYDVGGEEIPDVKVYADHYKNPRSHNYSKSKFPFISTEDRSFPEVKKFLFLKKFPKPSSYEKAGSWENTPKCPTCGNLI